MPTVAYLAVGLCALTVAAELLALALWVLLHKN
jgi:hypothetical protein